MATPQTLLTLSGSRLELYLGGGNDFRSLSGLLRWMAWKSLILEFKERVGLGKSLVAAFFISTRLFVPERWHQ